MTVLGHHDRHRDHAGQGLLAALAAGFVLVVALAGTGATEGADGRAAAAGGCDRFAAPSGSDSARGTFRRPFRSAPRLADALRPGQTGCFRGGTYSSPDLKVETPRTTLRPYQNEQVTLRADIRFRPWARSSVLAGMRLDGTSNRSEIHLTLSADKSVLRGNTITNRNSSASCVYVAPYHSSRPPRGVRIVGNRIHDCGELPSTNHHHGIYVAGARRTVIKGNWIYENATRGIQLYPSAQRTRVRGNIVDSNGWGVSVGGEDPGSCSNGNKFLRNVIANSRLSWNVHSTPSGPRCHRNVVRRNCVFSALGDQQQGSNGGVQRPSRSYRARRNRIARPRYLDRGANNFRLREGSACWRLIRR
jgi:parallel beta-helix repeat protein